MSTPITTAIGRVQPLYRGEYNSSLNYEKLDNVLYNGSTYIIAEDNEDNQGKRGLIAAPLIH